MNLCGCTELVMKVFCLVSQFSLLNCKWETGLPLYTRLIIFVWLSNDSQC